MKIALIQMKVGMDKEKNLQKARDMVLRAGREGARIAVLPEMFLSVKYTPIGATRITPPQPLLLLIGSSMLPVFPLDKAARQVLPGARLAKRSGTFTSQE